MKLFWKVRITHRETCLKNKSANAKLINLFSQNLKFRKDTKKCVNTMTNVVFLKTHKTGSSTMSNIMLRFAGEFVHCIFSSVLLASFCERIFWMRIVQTFQMPN